MQLTERIVADLKAAMLSGDTNTVSVLRMLRAELKNAEIATSGPLSEEAEWQVVRKEVKKREDAAIAFASRPESAQKEEAEAVILRKYLPAQVDPAVIQTAAEKLVSEIENPSPKNRGQVISSLLQQFAGQTDGKTVSAIVSQLLP